MQFTAQQIATLLQGKIEGDPNAKVNNVARIEEAVNGCLSFVSNPKYEEYLYTSGASIIIVNETLETTKPVLATLVRVTDAYSSFAFLLEKYNEMISGGNKTGIEQPSYIAQAPWWFQQFDQPGFHIQPLPLVLSGHFSFKRVNRAELSP